MQRSERERCVERPPFHRVRRYREARAGARAVRRGEKQAIDAQLRRFTKTMERLGEDVVRMRLALRQRVGDRFGDDVPPVIATIWLDEQAAARKRRPWLFALIALASALAGFVAALSVSA